MPHKLISAIFALLFLILVQTANSLHILVFALAGYVLMLMAYNAYYLKKRELFSFWAWLKPVLVVAGMVSLLFVVYQWNVSRGLLLLAAVIVIFLTELSVSLISEQRIFLLTLITYFGLVFGLFDLQFTFGASTAGTLALLGISTYLVARVSFDYIPQPRDKKNFFAILLTLALIETGWAALYLPVHFSIIALIIFNVFYVLWIIIYYHLFSNLTAKKIYFHITFSTLILILALFSTPWK